MLSWLKTKRLSSCEASPQVVIEQATKVLAHFKLHTPPEVLAEALQGHSLLTSRQTLVEECNAMADKVVGLDHFMKKRTLESALAMWIAQKQNGCNKHNQRTWLKCMRMH